MKATFILLCLSLISPSIIAVPVTTPELSKTVVEENDFKIYFYNKNNTSNNTEVDITDEGAVQETEFSNVKQTFFVVHGWQNNVDSEMCTSIRNALLENNDVNVFVVDWSKYSMQNYSIAVSVVKPLGILLGAMIKTLQSNNGLILNNTAIVGHSLGAHLSGIAGTALESECDYVVGLDPAAPYFSYNDTSGRISTSSGKFVEIIHTCGFLLSFIEPLGDADYYPNGGMKQVGCDGEDEYGACSHGRSYKYYAESLVSGQFKAQNCDSYEQYENGTCVGNYTDMGGFDIDKSAKGKYYLNTNSESPYAISDE